MAILFVPLLSNNLNIKNQSSASSTEVTYADVLSSSNFFWPLPNNKRISSYFGRRNSPTAYASSYHKGIDIPASPGTNIYAAMSGTVIMAKFNGSGGCTVTVQNGDLYTSYCHVSPNFIVAPRSIC